MSVFVYLEGELREMILAARALAQELKATEKQASETVKAVERATESSVGPQGPASTNNAGSSSTQAGQTGSQLDDITAALAQQAGRR